MDRIKVDDLMLREDLTAERMTRRASLRETIAKGMPEQSVAWFQDGPAFDVLDSSVVRVIGRYPTDPDKVLRSGWVLHPERVAGRAALLEVHLGRGRVVLFGFRPQYRGQSLATYPLLFNSLQVP